MYLYLDTTERDSFEVAIISEQGIIRRKKVKSVRQHSEKLLKTINDLLNSSSKPHPSPPLSKGRELQGIAVVQGPGSFTSLRIGVATANALAYALAVTALGVKPDFPLEKLASLFKKRRKQGIILPEYGSEPHITSRKL